MGNGGVFKAQGKILKFDGFRKVLRRAASRRTPCCRPDEGQALDLLDLTASQHFTEPPPRYNEASLVKALEKEGIGRPSTYAVDHQEDPEIAATSSRRSAASTPPRSA